MRRLIDRGLAIARWLAGLSTLPGTYATAMLEAYEEGRKKVLRPPVKWWRATEHKDRGQDADVLPLVRGRANRG